MNKVLLITYAVQPTLGTEPPSLASNGARCLDEATRLEGAEVFQHNSSTQCLEPCSSAIKLLLGLLTLPDNCYTPQAQEVAKLQDQLPHCAVGGIQDDTVTRLQAHSF